MTPKVQLSGQQSRLPKCASCGVAMAATFAEIGVLLRTKAGFNGFQRFHAALHGARRSPVQLCPTYQDSPATARRRDVYERCSPFHQD